MAGSRGINGFAPLSGLPNLWCVFQLFSGERDGEEKSDGVCVVPFIQVQVEGNNTSNQQVMVPYSANDGI